VNRAKTKAVSLRANKASRSAVAACGVLSLASTMRSSTRVGAQYEAGAEVGRSRPCVGNLSSAGRFATRAGHEHRAIFPEGTGKREGTIAGQQDGFAGLGSAQTIAQRLAAGGHMPLDRLAEVVDTGADAFEEGGRQGKDADGCAHGGILSVKKMKAHDAGRPPRQRSGSCCRIFPIKKNP
jgi:hypothetical protein